MIREPIMRIRRALVDNDPVQLSKRFYVALGCQYQLNRRAIPQLGVNGKVQTHKAGRSQVNMITQSIEVMAPYPALWVMRG
jgi:hypothetical protein